MKVSCLELYHIARQYENTLFFSKRLNSSPGAPPRPSDSETVYSSASPLQRENDVGRGHGLSPAVLRVADGVREDLVEEVVQDAPGRGVASARDSLHAASAGEAHDGAVGDSLQGGLLPVVLFAFAVLAAGRASSLLVSGALRHFIYVVSRAILDLNL